MLAHGAVLRKNGFSVEQIKALITDFHQAGLEASEVDMMELARKLSLDPYSVTPADIQKLREDGFADDEILDIVTAAALRNFFSRTLAVLGVEPDAIYREREPELWKFIMENGAEKPASSASKMPEKRNK